MNMATNKKDGFNVYYLYDKLNNIIIYVGSTTLELKRRLQFHCNDKTARKVTLYINEIGRNNISIHLIEKCDTKEKMLEREEYWTHYYNDKFKLLNIDFANKHSEESKKHIGNSRIYPKGKDTYNFGKHLSDETKRKLSMALRGKFAGEKNPMYGVHLCGTDNASSKAVRLINTGEIFVCIREAAERYNINRNGIAMNCRGERKSAGKLNGEKMIWEFVNNRKEGDLL